MSQSSWPQSSLAGRSFSLLALMVIVWLGVSFGVVSGLPLRVAGLSSSWPDSTLVWQGEVPAPEVPAAALVLGWNPESVSGDDRALGPNRPLMVSTGNDAWALTFCEDGRPQWIQMEGSGDSHSGSGGVVYHDEPSRALEILSGRGEVTGTWNYPAGHHLSGAWPESGGLWVNTWQTSSLKDLPAFFEAQSDPEVHLVTEHLHFLSREGGQRQHWQWEGEILVDYAFDREGAYLLSWPLAPPGDSLLRRLYISDGQSWRKSLEGYTPQGLCAGVPADPVTRAVWSRGGGGLPGDISPWPGRDLLLLFSDSSLVAKDQEGRQVFRWESEGKLLDVTQVGGRAVLLEQLPQGVVVTFLDARGHVAARHAADPDWHTLTPTPWGQVLAWGGTTVVAYDRMSRRMRVSEADSPVLALAGGYGDTSGSWGLVTVLAEDKSLKVYRLDWSGQ